MPAFDDFQTAMAAAVTAFDGRDYDTARRKIIVARMYLAQIPNSASDSTSASWRDDLDKLEAAITAESGRSVSSVSVPTEFAAG